MKKRSFIVTFFFVILRLVLAVGLAILLAFGILKFLNIDLEVSYDGNRIELRNKNFASGRNLPDAIDDEYPNIADYQEDSFFYKQLDDNGKALYIGIKDNLENMKSGTYKIDFGTRFNKALNEEGGQDRLSDSYQAAVDALKFDSPEIFYIDFSKVYLNTYCVTENGRSTYTVYIDHGKNDSYLEEGFTKDNINQAISSIEEVKELIMSATPESTSNFDKILSVHNWLIDKIEYDESLSMPNKDNIYGALIEHKVTCQGYAKAFKYIMDGLNVPCVLVKGEATNSEGQTEKHMWDYVQINDNWYAIDVTWDDPIIIGGGEASSETRYKYFLKGRSFLENHTEEGLIDQTKVRFRYPQLIEK